MDRRTAKGRQGSPVPVVAWTYELPPEGGATEGLEGYAVESADGERLGSVFVVLRRGSARYLAVKRRAPRRRDLRLVPWEDVAVVDHGTETVELTISAERLARAPRLARDKGTGGEADAIRLTGFVPEGGGRGPARPRATRIGAPFLAGLGLGAIGLLAVLVAILFVAGPRSQDREDLLVALVALVLLGAVASALGSIYRDGRVRDVVGNAESNHAKREDR
ncbi:MAG: hypothetical protein M3304_00200 [Actinomycetota bacterium]|nr:hypothetical protein [Actinomycetota bacterium]